MAAHLISFITDKTRRQNLSLQPGKLNRGGCPGPNLVAAHRWNFHLQVQYMYLSLSEERRCKVTKAHEMDFRELNLSHQELGTNLGTN